MGKRNRQRRNEKRRRAHLAQGPRPGASPGLADLFVAAGIAGWSHRAAERDRLVDLLMRGAEPRHPAELARAVVGTLARAVGDCWLRGWQPLDLAHTIRRRLTAAHRRVCADVIGFQANDHGAVRALDTEWLEQVVAVAGDGCGDGARAGTGDVFAGWVELVSDRRRAVEVAAETFGLLVHLPTLPRLRPPPGEPGSRPTARSAPGCDPKLLARVRALLAMAESTSFPEEAEAFTAKAQQLITRHAVDRTLLAGTEPEPWVVGRRVLIDDPYANAKSMLLSEIAGANRSRAVWSSDLGFSTVFGVATDLDAVEILFASLLTQAAAAMTARSAAGGRRVRSFRQSFLLAFGMRIGERLRAAVDDAVDEAVVDHGDRFLPVLVAADTAAESACRKAFPDLVHRTVSGNNAAGWAAGRACAELAELTSWDRLRAG
jgi:Protein of unknown function (DUF2786)